MAISASSGKEGARAAAAAAAAAPRALHLVLRLCLCAVGALTKYRARTHSNQSIGEKWLMAALALI